MLARSFVLLILSGSGFVLADPADCFAYGQALDDLTAHLQETLSYVQSLVPYSGASCGGLLGSFVRFGSQIRKVRYNAYEEGVSNGAPEDYLGQPSFASDPQNCCALCEFEEGCVYWTHSFGSDPHCLLYEGQSTRSPLLDEYNQVIVDYADTQTPEFISKYGFRNTVFKISGKVTRGMWGHTFNGGSDYMSRGNYNDYYLTENVDSRLLVLDDGWEYCDFLGAFKFEHYGSSVSGASAKNANVGFARVVDALECCSLCVRGVLLDGSAISPCALWSFKGDHNNHGCNLRGVGHQPLVDCDGLTGSSLYACLQNILPCSAVDGGNNAFLRPDGNQCTGTFDYGSWVSGLADYSGFTPAQ